MKYSTGNSLIKLYDKSSIDSLPWEKMREGDRYAAFLSSLVKGDMQEYIANVKTEMVLLTLDDLVLPVTINQNEYQNSHICSPFTHYITAALDELPCIKNGWLQGPLKGIIKSLALFLKWGSINRVICVNNWLIPTNLYPQISQEQMDEITLFLKEKFPTHSILFRSLNSLTNMNLMKNLQQLNYKFILSRQIYLVDGSEPTFFTANNFKKDLHLVKDSPYKLEDITTTQTVYRIADLYQEIYLEKYQSHNPQFTIKWIDLLSRSSCWTLRILRKERDVDAVFAYLQVGTMMTMPFFGYDTSLPQNLGLYRLISTFVSLEAKNKKLIFNQSSGASSFKRLRRAIPQLEYNAVYTAHLPFRQRLPWILLSIFINKPGAYLMKMYEI